MAAYFPAFTSKCQAVATQSWLCDNVAIQVVANVDTVSQIYHRQSVNARLTLMGRAQRSIEWAGAQTTMMVGGACIYHELSFKYSRSLDDANDPCDDTIVIPLLISIGIPSPPDNPIFRKPLLDPNSVIRLMVRLPQNFHMHYNPLHFQPW